MKSLFQILIVALFGAITFGVFGMSPFAGSATAVVGSMLVPQHQSSLRAGLDLSAINSQLGAYIRKYEEAIWTGVFRDITLEKFMTPVMGVKSQYVTRSSTISEILQPHQPQWSPKGTVSIDAKINTVQHIKADVVIDNLDELFDSHAAELADENVERDKMTFIPWLINKHILPKIKQEMAYNSYNGVYAAPATPGTAGDSVDSVDGLAKIIADDITATHLTPFTTGAITPANIIDLVDDYVDYIDSTTEGKFIKNILLADELVRMYKRAYKLQYGTSLDYKGMGSFEGMNIAPIDGSTKILIGVEDMNGSQRMISTWDGNLIKMFNKVNTPEKMYTDLDKRDVILFTDFFRGYGYKHYKGVIVNDQA